MQSDGTFDECCGGDNAKVHCSKSEASGSSGSSDVPSSTDGTPSGDASVCSSVNIALIALVLAVSAVYAEDAVDDEALPMPWHCIQFGPQFHIGSVF